MWLGRRIIFTKGFKSYKRKYGLKSALPYLEGYYGIKRGDWGKFERKAKEALRKGKKSFIHP